jgi:hypothetical protein
LRGARHDNARPAQSHLRVIAQDRDASRVEHPFGELCAAISFWSVGGQFLFVVRRGVSASDVLKNAGQFSRGSEEWSQSFRWP